MHLLVARIYNGRRTSGSNSKLDNDYWNSYVTTTVSRRHLFLNWPQFKYRQIVLNGMLHMELDSSHTDAGHSSHSDPIPNNQNQQLKPEKLFIWLIYINRNVSGAFLIITSRRLTHRKIW